MARRAITLRAVVPAALLLALLALLLAAPAQAHVEPHPHILQRVEGGLVFSALLETDLLLERDEVDLRVHVVDFDTGEHPEPLRLEAHVAPAQGGDAAAGAASAVPLEPADEPGHFLARVSFETAAEYVLRVREVDANVTVELPFSVYPQPGYRFGWSDLRAPYAVAGEPLSLAFRMVDANGTLVDSPPSGELVVERWTPDGVQLLGVRRVPLAPTGEPGRLETPELRLVEGHHLLFIGIEDIGLPAGSRPPLPLYAHEPVPEPDVALDDVALQGAPAEAATPGPGAASLLIGAALVALARAAKRRRDS